MYANNLSKFKCKVPILFKNSYINREEFSEKIRSNLQETSYEGIMFNAVLFPSDVTIDLNNGSFDKLILDLLTTYSLKKNISLKLNFRQIGFVMFLHNQSKNYTDSDNYLINTKNKNHLFPFKIRNQKKLFRTIMNDEMSLDYLITKDKFISFHLKENILFCNHWIIRLEINKALMLFQYYKTTKGLDKKIDDYYNTYKSFFKKPSKNINLYKELRDIIKIRLPNDRDKKEQIYQYFQAECFVNECENVEKSLSELTDITLFIEENLKKLEELYIKNNIQFRIWFKKIIIKNTFDPVTIHFIDIYLYNYKNVEGLRDSLNNIIEHIKKYYV